MLMVFPFQHSLGQASIVEIGEAVMRCNNFDFALTMLKNEGLSLYEQNADSVILTNNSNRTADILIATMVRGRTNSDIGNLELKFAPNSRYYASLGRDMIKWDYQIRRDINSSFHELHKNARNYLGISVDKKGWISIMFMSELDASHRISKTTNQPDQTQTDDENKPKDEKQAVFENDGRNIYKQIRDNLKICKHCEKRELTMKLRIDYTVLEDCSIGNVRFESTGCKKQDSYIRNAIKCIKVISPAMVDGKPVKANYFTRLNLML